MCKLFLGKSNLNFKLNILSEFIAVQSSFDQIQNKEISRNSIEVERSCAVCGEDSWCGSDGCPLDPQ